MSGDQSATLSWGHTGDSRNLFIPDLMAVFFEEPGITGAHAVKSNASLVGKACKLALLPSKRFVTVVHA